MRSLLVSLAILESLTLAGCGGDTRPKNRDPVYKVSGQIMYKGSPVVQADVTFVCNEKKRSAFGRTDAQGKFSLTTFAPNDGAVAGKHVVLVRKIEATAGAGKEPEVSDAAYDPTKVDGSKPQAAKNELPAKYGDAATSDLFAVVTAEGNPEMVLELKD